MPTTVPIITAAISVIEINARIVIWVIVWIIVWRIIGIIVRCIVGIIVIIRFAVIGWSYHATTQSKYQYYRIQ